jgi:pyruvate kinase
VFTSNITLLNTLSLSWGVRAFYYDKLTTTDETFQDIQDILVREKYLQKGDIIINTASMPISKKQKTNTIKLSVVE